MKWAATNLRSVGKIFKVADVIVVDQKGKNYQLQQIPEVNGGIMIVSTG